MVGVLQLQAPPCPNPTPRPAVLGDPAHSYTDGPSSPSLPLVPAQPSRVQMEASLLLHSHVPGHRCPGPRARPRGWPQDCLPPQGRPCHQLATLPPAEQQTQPCLPFSGRPQKELVPLTPLVGTLHQVLVWRRDSGSSRTVVGFPATKCQAYARCHRHCGVFVTLPADVARPGCHAELERGPHPNRKIRWRSSTATLPPPWAAGQTEPRGR